MKFRNRPSMGSRVRVKFAGPDGYIWLEGTVLRTTEDRIEVRLPSGMKYPVPHGEGRYAPIEKKGMAA